MIKKLVSNALLSVLMDKKARDTLQASRDTKARKSADTAAPHPTPAAQRTDDGPFREGMTRDESTELIRQSLAEAEAELEDRAARKLAMTPERQALIENALAIRRSKTHIIDELDDESRDRLYVMAMHALDPERAGGK